MPATLVHAQIEVNEDNDSGLAVTLYYDPWPGEPTAEQITADTEALQSQHGDFILEGCPRSHQEHPTPLSKHAGLRRFQVW